MQAKVEAYIWNVVAVHHAQEHVTENSHGGGVRQGCEALGLFLSCLALVPVLYKTTPSSERMSEFYSPTAMTFTYWLLNCSSPPSGRTGNMAGGLLCDCELNRLTIGSRVMILRHNSARSGDLMTPYRTSTYLPLDESGDLLTDILDGLKACLSIPLGTHSASGLIVYIIKPPANKSEASRHASWSAD